MPIRTEIAKVRMLLFILGLTIFFTISVKWTLHKQRYLKYVRHLPAPKEFPILGSAYRFVGKNTKDVMDIFIDLTAVIPTPSRLWFGPKLVIIIGKPSDMQAILNSANCLEKAYIYRFLEKNVGLFSAPAHVWKPQRKLLNPTFNHKILTSFIPIFNQKAEVLSTNLDAKVNTSEMFDISKYIFACTLDMVCATTLGVDMEHQSNENTELLDCMEKMSEIIANRMVKVWLHPDCIYHLTADYRKHVAMTDKILNYSAKVRKIKQLEFKRSKLNSKDSRSDDEFFTTPQIFVNELLKMHEMGLINDRELDDHILTILIGGNETTALTASHVILLLAIHQDMQEKVYQEVKNAHRSQMSHTDYDTLAKLIYLEMFIKETMRHFPVGPFLAREALADTPIRDCVIPKGSIILLSIYKLHKDEDVWGIDSHKFVPEHFLPEKNATRHPYAYLPFSGGMRNCIGIKYGWMSMKIMISLLVRRYKFTTDLAFEDLVTKWDITLKLVNRHLVRIERRTY